MDQEKIGLFLKQLRKEKGLTQEELAEILNINHRSISRWENARTMPDFSILLGLSKIYEISVDELLKGERIMETKQTQETLNYIVEYTNNEKEILLKKLHHFAIAGVVCWIIFIILQVILTSSIAASLGLDRSLLDNISSYVLGSACGASIVLLLLSSKYINKINDMKKRILHK